jgi:hypothetical protein
MFDFDRFARLAVAHWAEHRRSYAWFLGIGVVLHAVLLLLSFAGKDGFAMFSTDGQQGIHVIGLFVLTPIFAGRYFLAMADRRAALLTLMRPASTLEKWLLAVLVVMVLYPLAFTVAYFLCDIPAWLISRARAAHRLAELGLEHGADSWEVRKLAPEQFQLYVPFANLGWRRTAALLLILATFQAFAMLGSLTFRAVPFIKTLLAAVLLVLLMVLVTSVFDSEPGLLFGYWDRTNLLSPLQKLVYPALWCLVPAGLWLACLLALREREIAA